MSAAIWFGLVQAYHPYYSNQVGGSYVGGGIENNDHLKAFVWSTAERNRLGF